MGGSPREIEGRPVQVIVRGEASGIAQEVIAGKHHLSSDEPTASGGTDTGPDPYALLLASLGSCTSMTIAMYARRKRWPLEAVTVRLSHGKIHAEDCAHCDSKEGRIDRIERTIELHGDLDSVRRQRLLEIAAKCPVHRSLIGEIDIVSRLV